MPLNRKNAFMGDDLNAIFGDGIKIGEPSRSLAEAIKEGNSEIVKNYISDVKSGKSPQMSAVVGGIITKSPTGVEIRTSTVVVPCPEEKHVVMGDQSKKSEFQKIIEDANRNIAPIPSHERLEYNDVTERSVLNHCQSNYIAVSRELDKNIKR